MLEMKNGVVEDDDRGFTVPMTQGHMGTITFMIAGPAWEAEFTTFAHYLHNPPLWAISRVSRSDNRSPIAEAELRKLIEEIVTLQASHVLNCSPTDVIATFDLPPSVAALYLQRPSSSAATSPRQLSVLVLIIFGLALYMLSERG